MLLLTVAAASACAKAKPATVADGPPLAMPAAAAPGVRAAGGADSACQAPPPEVARMPNRRSRRRLGRRARRPAPAPPGRGRQPEPEPPAPVAAAPAPAEPAASCGRAVGGRCRRRAAGARSAASAPSRDLGRVDYRKLSNEGRSQYDQAQRFAEQAEQALKERNFVFAATLADKAATLASQLAASPPYV